MEDYPTGGTADQRPPDVENEGGRFTIIPEALLFDPAISADAVRVYGVLRRHGDSPGRCYPSYARIAKLIGRAPKSIVTWVRELEDAGWVQRVPRFTDLGDPDTNGYRMFLTPRSGGSPPAKGQTSPPARGEGSPQVGGVNESKVNESKVNERETANAVSRATPETDALCTQLAEAIALHTEGDRPVITAKWRDDMRLLLTRGPLHVQGAKGIPPEHVAASIRYLFTDLAERGRDGFCWADQIRSPGALRDHWAQLKMASKRATDRGLSPGGVLLARRARRAAANSEAQPESVGDLLALGMAELKANGR